MTTRTRSTAPSRSAPIRRRRRPTDASRSPTSTPTATPPPRWPAFVRFDGVVGHFSSYAVGIVTPTSEDETPPTITASATSNGAPYASGTWTSHDVVVHYDCTDDASGVASVTDDQTVSAEGDGQSRSGTCTDNAGNHASCDVRRHPDRQDATERVDHDACAGSLVHSRAKAVQASYSCSDGLSGYGSCAGTVANGSKIDTSNWDRTRSRSRAADNAGNTASATVQYTAAGALVPGTTSCNGYFMGTGKDVVVPAGAVCHLLPGHDGQPRPDRAARVAR